MKEGGSNRNLPFFVFMYSRLLLGVLFDCEFASVVSAFGTYMVVHYLCAAIAASCQLSALQRIVRSSLGRSGLRESVFWMWHIITFFYLFISASLMLPSEGQFRCHSSLALLFPR